MSSIILSKNIKFTHRILIWDNLERFKIQVAFLFLYIRIYFRSKYFYLGWKEKEQPKKGKKF